MADIVDELMEELRLEKMRGGPSSFWVEDFLVVSDPCYVRGTWCAAEDIPAKKGQWLGVVEYTYLDWWGLRVKRLYAFHKDAPYDLLNYAVEEGVDLGVDSGQMGIFSTQYYPTDTEEIPDDWYDAVCAVTLAQPQWGVVKDQKKIFGGVVSSSGIGDGSYTLHVAWEDGKAIGVRVDFLEE